tara:strand:+ start:1021 stop:1284 length:264 start_codon:yes stop_codon:yes gene_type:complete
MKKYIVYGRSSCPYCMKVVNRLFRDGKTFYVEMFDNHPEKLEEIKKRYNHPTIPVVIIQDNKEILIGGWDDTIAHLKNEVSDDTGEA